MAEQKREWQQIGEEFIKLYYSRFDSVDRSTLGELYYQAAWMTWEGEMFNGKELILAKLTNLPFKTIQHSITKQDCQPTPDDCIVVMVTGQLKADNDPIMGFQQVFQLRNEMGAWGCSNDMFRLSIHNYGA